MRPIHRVRLLKTLEPDKLPIGTLGTVYGDLPDRGMVRVHWDLGCSIPMYRNEIEPVEVNR